MENSFVVADKRHILIDGEKDEKAYLNGGFFRRIVQRSLQKFQDGALIKYNAMHLGPSLSNRFDTAVSERCEEIRLEDLQQ